MNQRANVIFTDPEASKYAWGMGFHWYETWAGGAPMYDNVAKVHEAFPDKISFYRRLYRKIRRPKIPVLAQRRTIWSINDS